YEALKKLPISCNHYAPPTGRMDLKEAIIQKLAKENNIHTEPNNIIVTTGSQEGLMLASMASIDVGEEVVIPDPGYMGYAPTIELLNGVPIRFELKEDEHFAVNTDRLKKVIDKKRTKAIILCTPSNPTGNVITKKILEELADLAIENDLYIFTDEAYEHIVYEQPHISLGSLNGMEDHAVSFYTASKSYAMCGFRVGYAVGPQPLIQAMTQLHPYTTISAPNPAQLLLKEALTMNKKYITTMVKEYQRRRDYLVKKLNMLGLPTIPPAGAFYTFSNIQNYSNNSTNFAGKILKQAKVAVMPGIEFGRYGEGYIRCSFATQYEKIAEAMTRLEQFLKKY
ncbi:MAG: aminotransferase class I/II-fold pyridoxal phosphate-dependent enzyme, partial [Nanoarchaeota archaeon]|nr:aminotransferase class I/II-fold pyridoxal phosphate-dependent enzyme [Nanoarchaeota archaeon]